VRTGAQHLGMNKDAWHMEKSEMNEIIFMGIKIAYII
jgi:hypothetical protein